MQKESGGKRNQSEYFKKFLEMAIPFNAWNWVDSGQSETALQEVRKSK